MKRSRLLQIIKEEVSSYIAEYGAENLYYNSPGGFESMAKTPYTNILHFDNKDKWQVTAQQMGAVVMDRGDDWAAIMPNQDLLGTFSKMNGNGTLSIS
mgnify:CR=1 FL=1